MEMSSRLVVLVTHDGKWCRCARCIAPSSETAAYTSIGPFNATLQQGPADRAGLCIDQLANTGKGTLITGGMDRTVCLWDTREGEFAVVLEIPSNGRFSDKEKPNANSCCVSP
jgi:hypothetical protein